MNTTARYDNNRQIYLTYEFLALGIVNNGYSKIFNTIIFETKWNIWKFRNKCKYTGKEQNLLQMFHLLKQNLYTQIKYCRLYLYFSYINEAFCTTLSR